MNRRSFFSIVCLGITGLLFPQKSFSISNENVTGLTHYDMAKIINRFPQSLYSSIGFAYSGKRLIKWKSWDINLQTCLFYYDNCINDEKYKLYEHSIHIRQLNFITMNSLNLNSFMPICSKYRKVNNHWFPEKTWIW